MAALALVNQLEAEAATEAIQKQQVLAIVHDENVSCWIETINQWFRQMPDQEVCFAELGQQIGLPWVEVWLAVLLGDFDLEQRGKFYQSPIWVKRLVEVAANPEH